jgi:hypothetical protein
MKSQEKNHLFRSDCINILRRIILGLQCTKKTKVFLRFKKNEGNIH